MPTKPRAPFQVLVFPYLIDSQTGAIEYAVFLREDMNVWQGVAGGGDEGEEPIEAAKRETFEEAGIKCEYGVVSLDTMASIPVYGFANYVEWGENTYVIPEYSFGMEVKTHSLHLSNEHKMYKWGKFDEVILLLKWDSNKTALWELNQRLIKKLS